MPKKPTYWVRSKQNNEISGFNRKPVPAEFKSLADAKLYRQDLNLHRGPYHPGYIVEEQNDTPPPFSMALEIQNVRKEAASARVTWRLQ